MATRHNPNQSRVKIIEYDTEGKTVSAQVVHPNYAGSRELVAKAINNPAKYSVTPHKEDGPVETHVAPKHFG